MWSADLWTADAVDWVTAQGEASKPWYLYLAYTAPHAGSVGSVDENDIPAPRVGSGPYADKLGTWPAVEVHFATAVTEIDRAVGSWARSFLAIQLYSVASGDHWVIAA